MSSLEFFLQFIFNGVIAGSLYALIAAGFSIIYNTNKFIHFAHGGVSIVGGYFFYTLSQTLGQNYFFSAVLGSLATGVVGYLIYRFTYQPLKDKNASNVILLLAGIALLIIIQNVLQIFYSEQVKTIQVSSFNTNYSILGAIVTKVQLIILAICGIVFAGLFFLVNKTTFGRSMRAVANNEELAKIIGINTNATKGFSFFIGSTIGGLGGVLIALDQGLTPSKGTFFILKGFTGAIVGGLESVSAAIIGSYFLGLIENLSIIYLPSEQKLTVAFLLLFFFLVFRPQGIMGFKSGGRK